MTQDLSLRQLDAAYKAIVETTYCKKHKKEKALGYINGGLNLPDYFCEDCQQKSRYLK